MRLDSLIRLIESADWMAFREIAMRAIIARGYRHVELSDGWRDGGRDLRVFQLGQRPLPIAIQVSVEKDWKAKIAEDARKVVADLNLTDMMFVSSRRIADAEFQSTADDVLVNSGVRLSKMDSQAIASMAV